MRAYREMGDEQVDLLTGEAPADVFESLNLSQMVALFPLPAHERAAFVKEHEVEGKSVREIEALVAEAVAKGREEARDELRAELQEERDAKEGAIRRRDEYARRLEEAETARANAEVACDKAEAAREKWNEIAGDLKRESDELKIRHEAEVRELREQADRLAAALEAARSEPVQERIVYVEQEPTKADAAGGASPSPTQDGEAQARVDALVAQLDEVQRKLDEAEQRAAAAAQRADARVQAVNFALREIAQQMETITEAIEGIEANGDGELAGKLGASATKALKKMTEGALWYDLR